jgi:hypothetical protein
MITPATSRLQAAATNAMAEAVLKKRLGDLERRHDKTRGLLLNALTIAILGLAGFTYKPEGMHAFVFGFCGALLSRWFLKDDRVRLPMSRFDKMCLAVALAGLLVLAVATVVFFSQPLARFGS